MALAELIRVAEQQRQLLSRYSLTVLDGHMDALERLSVVYSENLATVENIRKKHIESLERMCKPTLDKAKTVSEELSQTQFRLGPSFRKSFEAIYTSIPARESEDAGQRLRKNKQYERALKIQELGCDGAIVWAGILTTSDWAQRLSATKLEYLLKNFPRPRHECLPTLLKALEVWGNEQPLVDCTAFRDSLTALHSRSNEILVDAPEPSTESRVRDILHAFSNMPVEKISSINDNFNDKLLDAITHSRQLQMEKQRGETSSSCVTILIPSDDRQDGSINIRIQRDAGFQMRDELVLESLTLS